MTKLQIVGGGKMGEALLGGLLAVTYWGSHLPMNPWPVNHLGVAAILGLQAIEFRKLYPTEV